MNQKKERNSEMTLPEDINMLQKMVLNQSVELNQYRIENNLLRERVNLLLQQLYGRKTEK